MTSISGWTSLRLFIFPWISILSLCRQWSLAEFRADWATYTTAHWYYNDSGITVPVCDSRHVPFVGRFCPAGDATCLPIKHCKRSRQRPANTARKCSAKKRSHRYTKSAIVPCKTEPEGCTKLPLWEIYPWLKYDNIANRCNCIYCRIIFHIYCWYHHDT